MNPAAADRTRPLAAVILSGGESRRMGAPKALIQYRGKTFVEHLFEVTRHQRVGFTRIVLGAHANEIQGKLTGHAAEIVVNADWANGPLSSIQAAMRSLPESATEGMILCPVDHPIVSEKLIAKLIEEFDSSGKSIALPTYHGRRGHPAIFRASLYRELVEASLKVGARQVVWAHAKDVSEVTTEEEGVVLNINDPATLERALSRLGAR
ncbi:MAG TPA: nucleotidyltransferase family protein [Candidatus Acidoferrales bacterium]|jgi:molybdenum cofactor cytidylyltransferase|nr:nucleotidyltransferase family protein [Candidatus Acidoferrales bacterium]